LAQVQRTNLEIARSIGLQPIAAIAEQLGILDDELHPYGKHIAKIDARRVWERVKDRPDGRYIDVTGITPTPLGEGKTLVTVGLSMALNAIGRRAIGTIRQPSLGPVFGIKGGADGVEYLPRAERQIREYTKQGLGSLPICIAKTPLSLSDNPNLKGRPSGFRLTIREVRAYTGAEFLCPIAGNIMTMPGLSSTAAVHQIDIDDQGEIVGLF
jgi:formyltetrahydrofolate synthetase